MSKKDEKDINISKLDKSLEGQGLLEDADDAEYERARWLSKGVRLRSVKGRF